MTMTTPTRPVAHLTGPTLLLARLAWLGVLAVVLGLFVLGAPVRYAQLLTASPQADTLLGQMQPETAARLAQSGLSLAAYAAYFTALEVLSTLVVMGVAVFIFWVRSADRMALFVSVTLLATVTALPNFTALTARQPGWAGIFVALRALFAASLFLLFYLFPNGRWAPRWTAWLALVWLAYTALWIVFPSLQPPLAFGRGLTPDEAPLVLWTTAWLISGILAQVWRYRYDSDALQRQRTKWAVFGFAAMAALFIAGVLILSSESLTDSGLAFVAVRLTGPSLILIGLMTAALSIGLSVLRYRLWDVDLVIRRTLVYSTLSVLLALVYFLSVVVLQSLVSVFGGQQSELISVLSTLTIAALFFPLRRRVQNVIDRRFYRRKYDAAKTLAAFAAAARDETDLNALAARLVQVVDETMQPESVGLWLRPAVERGQPAVEAADGIGP